VTDSITPPPELVQQWASTKGYYVAPWWVLNDFATRAAQWAADQELEACLRYAGDNGLSITRMRATRRPKSPSLKEQALLQLDTLNADLAMHGRGCDLSQIRRALEALPE
jgi:hypothetical protein